MDSYSPVSFSPDSGILQHPDQRTRPVGFDSLFDESFSLSPVKVSPSRKMLEDSPEAKGKAPEEIAGSPVALLRRDSLAMSQPPVPSSPATTLAAQNFDEASPSPLKHTPRQSFSRQSSNLSFSQEIAAFDYSFTDSIFNMSPIRLCQQTSTEDQNGIDASFVLAMEPQPSPVKQSPNHSPDRMGGLSLDTDLSNCSRVFDSMDFSQILPASSNSHDGKSPALSHLSPRRRSSTIFAEDGSPRISMSAHSSPITGSFFPEADSSFLGMEVQASPTKQSSGDKASSVAATAPDFTECMLPDDINNR